MTEIVSSSCKVHCVCVLHHTGEFSKQSVGCVCMWLTWKANSPEKSYMPHECMRLRVLRTASALSTRSPVIGQIPPLANVAAMTLPDSHVTSIEHSWKWKKDIKYKSLIWAIIASSTVKDNYVSEWQLIYLKVEVKGCHHVNSTGKTLQEKNAE